MGSNGAGKSTLLRAAAGLVEPQRGRIDAPRGVALLPQRPGDLFVHERVGDELRGEDGPRRCAASASSELIESDPRDLSGGERQRLALAIVVAGPGRRRTASCPARCSSTSRRGAWTAARKGELAELGARPLGRGAGGDDRDPRRRVRRDLRRPGRSCWRAARWPPTGRPASCSPGAGTSRARSRASSTAPRSPSRRGSRRCGRPRRGRRRSARGRGAGAMSWQAASW